MWGMHVFTLAFVNMICRILMWTAKAVFVNALFGDMTYLWQVQEDGGGNNCVLEINISDMRISAFIGFPTFYGQICILLYSFSGNF